MSSIPTIAEEREPLLDGCNGSERLPDRSKPASLLPAPGVSLEQLDEAVRRYAAALPPGAVKRFSLSPLDRTGVPVWAISYRGDDGYLTDSIGYGAVESEALCGAFGELTEDVHLAAALARCEGVRGESYNTMVGRFGADAVVDPLTLCLPAGSPYERAMSIDWTPVKRFSDDADCWVPREFVAFDTVTYYESMQGSREPLAHPISNGMGAGLSVEQAIKHGVLELLQRDGNCLSFRALDRGITVAVDDVEDVGLAALLQFAKDCGLHLMVKLAGTEFGMANVYAVGHSSESGPADRFTIQLTACGEAVHPCREIAIRKAVLEFLAARARKTFMHGPLEDVARIAPPGYLQEYEAALPMAMEESRSLEAMDEWLDCSAVELRQRLSESVFHVRGTVRAKWLPNRCDAAAMESRSLLQKLCGALHRQNMQVYYFDASDSAGCREHGVHSVKVIVPGLECETMSYGRIGMRGVAKANEAELPFVVREQGAGRSRIRLTERDEEIVGGPHWLDRREVDRIVGPLYPLYREPNSHVVRIARRRGYQRS